MNNLACRQELMEVLELKSLSHEDLNSLYCVDWPQRTRRFFSRKRKILRDGGLDRCSD